MVKMKSKGKLIVIEGSDGSGKATQTKLLVKRAQKEGYLVNTISFPIYDSPSGKLITAYLNGKYGPLDKVNPKFASELYAQNRLDIKKKIENELRMGINLIFDRYVSANYLHQASRYKTNEEKLEMIKWINHSEFEVNNLPVPDTIAYLDLDPKFAIEAMKKQGRKGDLHENDTGHLQNAWKMGRMITDMNIIKSWKIFNCIKSKTERKGVEELNAALWDYIQPILTK